MFRKPKEIKVNAASMVEMKAELVKKRSEFDAERRRAQATSSDSLMQTKPLSPTTRKKKRSDNDYKKNFQGDNDVDKEVLEKSQESLRKKAKLYDQLQKGDSFLEDEFEEKDLANVMVDFDQKLYDKLDKKNPLAHENEVQEEGQGFLGDDQKDDDDDDDDEWIEYEDEFGRTRYARKSELNQKSISEVYMEGKRKEWDQAYEKRLSEPAGPSFYDVEKEIRTRGVSHYRFSLNPDIRRQQQEELNQLREQTLKARMNAEKIKQSRKEKMKLRLQKVMQRRQRLKDSEVDGEDDLEEEDYDE